MKKNMSSAREVENKLARIKKNLSAKPWFKKEAWQISAHPFPRKDPTGMTFHVFKKNWFNEDSGGIHIESHLDFDSKKQKKTYLTIHLLHQDLIPGTKIKRIELSKPVIDAVYKTVSQWPGYKFRAGKYGQQPFTLLLNGVSEQFEEELEKEITRLCRLFGPVVDATLLVLLKR